MSERPADVLQLMLDRFLTIEEGREKHRKAGGKSADFEAFVAKHRREPGFEVQHVV